MFISTNMRGVTFYCIILILILLSSSHAQVEDLQFEKISIESGLSQSSVLCIYQDHKNFMWFGTYAGLNRYDGYNFKVYKAEPGDTSSLSNNNVECIVEDHSGNIWIGTEDGLNCYDRDKEKFTYYQNDPADPTSLSTNYIRSLYEDRQGDLWVGTYGGGLNKFDHDSNKFVRYLHDADNPQSISHNNVLCILEDRQGRLWVGTDGGLNYFDRQKGKFIHFLHDPRNPASLSHDSIWRLYEDRSGNLWIASWGGGLNLFDPEKKQVIRYQNDDANPYSLSNNVARSICEDRDGNLWIGTDGGGLNILNPRDKDKNFFLHYRSNPNDPNSLSSNSLLSIFKDRSGIIWIGTNFGGINKYNPDRRKFAHYKGRPGDANSLNNNSILAIHEDSLGNIWLGTNGDGLNRFDRRTNTYTQYTYSPRDPHSLSNNVVRSICSDNTGKIWVGTDAGLNSFDAISSQFTRYLPVANDPQSLSNHTIFDIYTDRSGDLWICSMDGLNRFNQQTGKFVRYMHNSADPAGLSDGFVWSITEDNTGQFWIGTNTGGLNQLDPQTGIFTHYNYKPDDSTALSADKIICIYQDDSGVIWFGTQNGLNKWNPETESFRHYGERDGLPSNSIQAILNDGQGNLWVSSNKGLSKFDPRTLACRNYLESDGLQSNEFGVNTCCKLASGELVFGGINGFNIFFPDSISNNPDIPGVVITNFMIYNKPVNIDEKFGGRALLTQSISECKEIRLSYKDNVFSFEFAALSYASSQDNLYAYMMEGFDKEWIFTNASRRFATYTNLPGGDYIFRVKAANNDKIWNEEGTSIHIIITPPFWQLWWFQTLVLLLILALIYTIFKIRIKSIEAHRRELEIKVEERTHQLSEKATELEKSNSDLAVAKNETDNILHNVEEGFFLIDQNYIISSQYSSALEAIFCRKNLAHLNLLDFLATCLSAEEVNNTNMFLKLLFDDSVNEESIVDLNPLIDREFVLSQDSPGKVSAAAKITKYLNFNFKRIKSDENNTIELITTVRDVTEPILLAIQLKKEEARRERLMQLILGILDVEPDMLRDFNESARRELDFIDKSMNQLEIEDVQKLLVKIFRSMHLIKGNAKLLNIDYFAEQAHQFENIISETQQKSTLSEKDLRPLREKLHELQTGMDEMESVIGKMSQLTTHKGGKKRTDTRYMLQSLENLINSFSTDLGKKIKFQYSKFNGRMIPNKYHLLIKEVLIQLVRNSISHGIELPEERKRIKKPPFGKIEISTFKRNGSVGFRIRDDGRGLQIEKLRQKAIQSGKWKDEEIKNWNEQQIAELIFASGITTSDKVDMVAGRGVGMDGVKHRIQEHQGEIRVSFNKDQFCEFEIILPAV
jgi:ligand-binding sensor domain-containing protein/signal transduction histidine kinase